MPTTPSTDTTAAAAPGGRLPAVGSNWAQDMPTPDAYWMNRILYDVHHQPSHLARYRADPAAYMQDVPLAPALKRAISDNDIGAMYLAGVNPYLLRAHCLGLQIPEQQFVASLRAVASPAPGAADEGRAGAHG